MAPGANQQCRAITDPNSTLDRAKIEPMRTNGPTVGSNAPFGNARNAQRLRHNGTTRSDMDTAVTLFLPLLPCRFNI